MPLAEDNDVLEKLATAMPDPALGGSVLPRAAIGDATGFVRMALMNSITAGLNIESPSKTRYRGAVSYGTPHAVTASPTPTSDGTWH